MTKARAKRDRHTRRGRDRSRKRQRSVALVTALALFVPLLGTMIAVLLSSRAAPPCVEPGTPARDKQYPAPPCTFIDEFGRYEVEMQTSVGTLRMLINPRLGVAAANNFLFLAQEGFYNGTTFHRVENDDNGAFAQGGDPTGTGRGGPGYTFVAESPSPIAHYGRGVVALLNPQDPNKTGSQFFIVARDLEDISKPGQTRYYTPIGFLADETSRSVLDQIVAAPRQDSRPVTPVVIHSARIKLISSS